MSQHFMIGNGNLDKTARAMRELSCVEAAIAARLLRTPLPVGGDHVLNPDFSPAIDAAISAHAGLTPRSLKPKLRFKPAAVLIGLVPRPAGLMVLLTKRRDHLRTHAGQVALPGGKIDAEDASAVAAALRETHEEVGIAPDCLRVLGQLGTYYSGSGFAVSPVIAHIDRDAKITANPDEVDYVFEVPLSFLMNEAHHIKGSRVFEGKERYFYTMPYEDHYIWGVTAGILRLFQQTVFVDAACDTN
ncbi:CoA pyrophosphatase [Polycladidibacter stylochi]|uniref:CoA pyrophosphatase n=1 Tax=Polycladidibacter stylochi TaxID=1807766 RepID=UPI00082C475E|nr:CoA pyrophosphatase [Pseudovibrio stylochi]